MPPQPPSAPTPQPAQQPTAVDVDSKLVSPPQELPRSWWKRLLSLFGYVVAFLIAFQVFTTLCIVIVLIASFTAWSSLDTLPAGAFVVAKFVALVLAFLFAWMTGSHFKWLVFRHTPKPASPKSHRIRRFFFWTASAIFILIAILLYIPVILGLIYKDLPPIDDSDLQLQKITVSDEQNALPELLLASNSYGSTTYNTDKLMDIVAGKTWDEAFAARVVASSTDSLAHLANAANKEVFQDPNFEDPNIVSAATLIAPLEHIRILGKLNSLYALQLAHTNKSGAGLQRALMNVSIGQKIEDSQGFIIHWLVGSAIKTQGLQTIELILASTTVSQKDLSALSSALTDYHNDGSGLVKALKMEYYHLKNTANVVSYGTFGIPLESIDRSNFYWHPNENIGYLANDKRQQIEEMHSSCKDDSAPTFEPTYFIKDKNILQIYLTPNAIGKLVNDIITVSFSDLHEKICNENALIDAITVQIAKK